MHGTHLPSAVDDIYEINLAAGSFPNLLLHEELVLDFVPDVYLHWSQRCSHRCIDAWNAAILSSSTKATTTSHSSPELSPRNVTFSTLRNSLEVWIVSVSRYIDNSIGIPDECPSLTNEREIAHVSVRVDNNAEEAF